MTAANTSFINEGWIDRTLRAFLGLAFFQLAFFWVGGWWAAIFYGLSAVMFITAIVGFCPIYKALGLRTNGKTTAPGKVWLAVAAVAFIALLIGGSYGSNFFSKKFYLEDFNAMNNYYKQALFFTGQENREKAVENYDQLVTAYADFEGKYLAYHPYALKGDGQFDADLTRVEGMIADVADNVHTGDLHEAHLMLEEVRPVFQDIFKRNNFSMLAVALVDFHDAMELMLDAATAQDAAEVQAVYPQVSEKLQAVEAEANDAEIQAIRANLDELLHLAESGTVNAMPAQGDQLKSSFVKVYLQRG
jgi:tetratricopeptide (TPR) repeat protein